MKKNFKFMLLSLLAMVSTTVFAQRNVNDKFPAGNFVYEVNTVYDDENDIPGEVTLIGIRDGKNPIVSNVLDIPGYMEATLFDEVYKFNVIALGTGALQNTMDASGVVKNVFGSKSDAKTVNFPATIAEIPANCFNGYTNVTAINFAANSELTTINNGAFSTTQITSFDFTNCKNLASLTNAVFVEAAPATNSYITSITLPESSKLLKHIGTAFQRLTELTEINNLEKSSIEEVDANAFQGCAKLKTIELPGTVKTIATGAFGASGVENLTINVDKIQTIGDGTNTLYYDGTDDDDITTLKKLTLKGDLGGIIMKNAFKGAVNLATLDLSQLNFASLGQIATSAFEGCTKIESVTIGNINDKPATGATIDADAFKGCTKLATVTIGDINSVNAIGTAAFGDKLKTVTIGTVKAGNATMAANAFKYADVTGTSLTLAGTGKYLSSDDALTPIFIAAAFDFSAVTNAANAAGFVGPVINIGEIKSKGGVFAGGDITLPTAATYATNIVINFTGDIAAGGLDAMIIDNSDKVDKINFSGEIATGGIEANAFANLAAVMEITFTGSLAEEAIAAGAFEALKADSKVVLDYTPADATVNPFVNKAFSATANSTTTRDILLEVTNGDLKKLFQNKTKGLTTNGVYDVYRVKFYVAPVEPDNSFLVYPDKNNKKVAWARINFSRDQLSETLNGGAEDLKIQRVQTIDGAKVKLTLYATYTDEDDALKASTIYMVPLKVKDGYYHIAKSDNEVIIAKAEKATDFTYTDEVKSHKVAVAVTGYVAGNESLWTGLTNTELHIANNDMTNQQLCDKTAYDDANHNGTKDFGEEVDIYRGGTDIVEDLYIMNDPSKNNGFRIANSVIEKKTDGTGAHINAGWYYMLLKHYEGGPTAARVVWMDDDQATGIFGVKTETNKKNFVEDDAIYTLQGVRVSPYTLQKGKIYIQGGKKFIFK